MTSDADRTPTNRASLRSNSLAKRPVVNQPSRAESTTEQRSSGPMTLPETGTGEVPGTNSRRVKASAWYSAVRAKICLRNCSARSLIGIRILKPCCDWWSSRCIRESTNVLRQSQRLVPEVAKAATFRILFFRLCRGLLCGVNSVILRGLFPTQCAPVAQLDRATGYEPVGRRFDSFRAHHFFFVTLLSVSTISGPFGAFVRPDYRQWVGYPPPIARR